MAGACGGDRSSGAGGGTGGGAGGGAGGGTGGGGGGGPDGAISQVRIAVGLGDGGSPAVAIYEGGLGSPPVQTYDAFDAASTSGSRVALGDIDGDGTLDLLAAPGSGRAPLIRAFDGVSEESIASFFAFDVTFTGGVQVASGDVDCDGRDDIIAAQGSGGGGIVRVFSGATLMQIRSFFAFGGDYSAEVSVAAADLDSDDCADLILGAGAGRAPQIRVVSGKDESTLASFFAFAPDQTAGLSVAAADVGGDGTPDYVIGYGGAPIVRVLDGESSAELDNFFAFDAAFTGGVRVAAADVDGDGRADVVAAPGAGGAPQVKIFSGPSLAETANRFVFDPGVLTGVNVAARRL